MKLTQKRKKRTKALIVTLLIILSTPIFEGGRMLNGARKRNAFAGKDIICTIDLGNDMYSSEGLVTGFNYELLGRFASDNRCSIRIMTGVVGEDCLDSLSAGKIDILAIPAEKAGDRSDLHISRTVDGNTVWAVKGGSDEEIRQINSWLSYYTATKDFSILRNTFHTSYDPHKRAGKGIISNRISPYDGLIRSHAAQLGWDWRMLAAVIYQESKFSISSSSHRGAQGLMQVMTHTGAYYNVSDLTDPKQNIKAGCSHLKRLQNLLKGDNLDHEELIKFTLAAYNAGEGKIAECRSFAKEHGADADRWEEFVRIIPMMREEGLFKGYETIAYVENVMSLYDSICKVCPEI